MASLVAQTLVNIIAHLPLVFGLLGGLRGWPLPWRRLLDDLVIITLHREDVHGSGIQGWMRIMPG